MYIIVITPQITVGYKKPRSYRLQGSAKKIGKSLARGTKVGLLHRLLQSTGMKQHAADSLAQIVRREVQTLCSDTFASVFRERSQESMEHFSWDILLSELQIAAPISTRMLQACMTTKQAATATPVLVMFMAMLLKYRNSKMNMVQAMVSLILYAGHAGKKVMLF